MVFQCSWVLEIPYRQFLFIVPSFLKFSSYLIYCIQEDFYWVREKSAYSSISVSSRKLPCNQAGNQPSIQFIPAILDFYGNIQTIFKQGFKMGIVLELFVWFITEFVFWGIMFWTGYGIMSILSLGRWRSIYSKKDKAKQRQNPKFIITALIGFLVWLGSGIVLTLSMLSS